VLVRSGKTRSGAYRPRGCREPGWKWRLSKAGSSNPVQQTIEALAKERGIDPSRLAAIEDAVLTASRKVFRGREPQGRFNPETGARRPGGGPDRRRDG